MIIETGLRPGEKLYEELLMDEEGLQDTPNKLIHIGKPIEISKSFLKESSNLYGSFKKPGVSYRYAGKYVKRLLLNMALIDSCLASFDHFFMFPSFSRDFTISS